MTSDSGVIPERALGTMYDSLRLRADIDVHSATFVRFPSWLSWGGSYWGRRPDAWPQERFLPVTLPSGGMIVVSVFALGDY